MFEKYGDLVIDSRNVLSLCFDSMIDSKVNGLALIRRVDSDIYICVDKASLEDCRNSTMLEE